MFKSIRPANFRILILAALLQMVTLISAGENYVATGLIDWEPDPAIGEMCTEFTFELKDDTFEVIDVPDGEYPEYVDFWYTYQWKVDPTPEGTCLSSGSGKTAIFNPCTASLPPGDHTIVFEGNYWYYLWWEENGVVVASIVKPTFWLPITGATKDFTVNELDLDVDANCDGDISTGEPDDSIEYSTGGLVGIGMKSDFILRSSCPGTLTKTGVADLPLKVFAGVTEIINGINNEFAVAPGALSVEGVVLSNSAPDVALRYTIATGCFDEIAFTVVKMDIDGDLNGDTSYTEDDPEEEITPGLFVGVNDDDDNTNGNPDKDDAGAVNEYDLIKVTVQVRFMAGNGAAGDLIMEDSTTNRLPVMNLTDATHLQMIDGGVTDGLSWFTVMWIPSANPAVIGYKYHLEPGPGTLYDIGNTHQVTIKGLKQGQKVNFVLHAYDAQGNMTHSVTITTVAPPDADGEGR